MRPADGGYGGRVVIDPTELRTVATRYTDAAGDLQSLAGQVGCHVMPEMPPEIVGRVTGELSAIDHVLSSAATPFTSGAKELKIRALWAEISAQGGTVDGLNGDQLRDFVAFMKDGSMLQYATRSQRAMAGFLVGELYQGTYKEPAKLIELAAIMKANGTDADFAGAFIEEFGPERFADIPRVIQAMEWGDRLLMMEGSMSDPRIDRDLAREFMLDGYRYEGDAVDLLSSFSMALATATYGGTLSRDTQRTLAHDEDTWAVAQLLHEGVFGAEFLRDVFHSGVIAEIGREGGNRNWGHQELSYWPIGINGDHQLPIDQKQIIMNALERNPEAITMAFADPVPEEFQVGVLHGEDDPLKILYDHMPPDDDAEEQLARMYTAGVDYGNGAGDRESLERAYRMTESLVDSTLHSDYKKDVMTEALASDLADHHMENIHLSTSVSLPAGAGEVDLNGENVYRLMFDKGDLTDLLREFGDHEDVNEDFLASARDYQAQLILDNTQSAAGDDYDWAKQIGGFDGILMNANDLENIEDFDADNARHKLVFSFANSVTGAVQSLHPAGAAAGIVTGPVLTALDDATGPSLEELVQANGEAKELITNQMHAAIVAGYHENGQLGGGMAPPDTIVRDNGHLIDIRNGKDLTEDQIRQFLLWMEQDTGGVTREAFEAVDQARDNRDIDTG